jgi:hypothetical protein
LERVHSRHNLWKTRSAPIEVFGQCSANNLTVKQRPAYGVSVASPASPGVAPADQGGNPQRGDLSIGFLLGLLVGEGHFGGDGRQPQVTLRMHIRHEETFEWLRDTYPGSALYGPYHHGGRSYYQWSARGRYLREVIVPLVQRHRDLLDAYTAARFDTMCERYAIAHETVAPAPDH